MNASSPIFLLLLQVGLILLLSRVMGMIFLRLRQPQVMGEMVAGIMLGPSVLGLLAPPAAAWLFPPDSIQYLEILSQIGVVFFLFLIGLELDPKLVRSQGRTALTVSLSSIALPFALGVGLTLYLYSKGLFDDPDREKLLAAALFMGAAMSITAFPVLARILTERNLHKTKIGAVTITCAAMNDVAAWVILAFVVAVAHTAEGGRAVWTAVLALAYVAFMFAAVRPLLYRLQLLYERQGRLSQNVVATIFLLVLASAYATDAIGIHAMFGAFLMGFIMPKGTQFVRHLSEKLEDFTVVLLLPIFFAYTGLQTHIGLIHGLTLWSFAGLIILVAVVGKFGGTALAARATGTGWRDACAMGVLMNTRGLMELVILNIGLQLEVLSDTVFAMMVIMALVTTAMATPLLYALFPARRLGLEQARARAAPSPAKAFSILIPVSYPRSAGPLLKLADMLGGHEDPQRRILALHLRRPADHEAYRSGLDDAQPPPMDAPMEALLAEARTHDVPVEPISFVSRDVPTDIARVADSWRVDLLLMGFHKPVIGKTILGGTVHKVLEEAPCDVAILVDRGFTGGRRVLVPYMGSQHDRLALELANRLARHTGASVVVLHVVPPKRDNGKPLGAKPAVERVFTEANQPTPVIFRVVEDDSPVDAVLREARDFDLIIIGMAEQWGLESHLFGFKAERIAVESNKPMLMVRSRVRAAAAGEAVTPAAPIVASPPHNPLTSG